MQFEQSRRFAKNMDANDPLRGFKNKFHVPLINGKPSIYLTGNSLGLQPKSVRKLIGEELDDWAALGVEGHVHARRPWVEYHKLTKKTLAQITGSKPIEVVAMNQLTVNLHLLMVSFYKPSANKFKILTEAGAFSSDQYVIESQLKFHGLNPEEALIELKPRQGESFLRTDDIVNAIEENSGTLALVFFGAVQYYTGQFFDVKKITAAGHRAGAIVGFDLAHAIGNVLLDLHDNEVDFAAWCSYKYLNSGPGAIAGAFVHERHSRNLNLPRFAGWWGHDEKERFKMKKGFRPMPGVDGWQLSNHPILLSATHLAALEIIQEAGMRNLRKKSEQLTGYLEFLLNRIDPDCKSLKLITPSDPKQRGCQLSLFMKNKGKRTFERLMKAGVMVDWREPDVIRLAPVPLYNSFEEVYRFSEILSKTL
ncbi:MAG TPA: kynureninase [Chryseosolibacter sp.]